MIIYKNYFTISPDLSTFVYEMDKLRKYLRILFPILFIVYLGNLIAFTHVHIVNGVTIVHSHHYQTNDDGTPAEEHTFAEFQLLHQLASVEISGTAFTQILLNITPDSCQLLDCQPVYPDYLVPFHGHLSLRAPPVI